MFRAHIRKEPLAEQSVYDHLHQVSELAKGFGAKQRLESACGLVGLLHDMGKLTKTFDQYIFYSFNHPEDFSLKGTVDHSTAGAKYIFQNFYCGERDPYRKLTAQVIALVICSHHGGIMDCLDLSGIDKFTKRMEKSKDLHYEEAVENFMQEFSAREIENLFDLSVKEIRRQFSDAKNLVESSEELSLRMGLLIKYIFSVLVDADRTDTYDFMENQQVCDQNDSVSFWEIMSERLEMEMALFSTNNTISQLRTEISLSCKNFAANPTGIYQLTVPTGGGKTLSSLRYALQHAKEKQKNRIVFVVPFTTIIDQNAKVIKAILNEDKHILEHHSNLIIEDQNDEHERLTENWDSPIILTTMVQFLETMYKGGTQTVRRLHNLSNSIIVFDEVQAVPIKCMHLFNVAVNFLSEVCGATIVLCTATQPVLSQTKKPLHLSERPQMIEDFTEKYHQFKRVNLVDARKPEKYSTEELRDFVFTQAQDKRNALVILNTKKSAKALFQALAMLNDQLMEAEGFTLYHLSTSMCPAHRKEIVAKLKFSLQTKPTICVSTQLIEAGVDISFACVIRSLAGLDSIAQAAGRCNRHGEKDIQNAYIVNLVDENVSRLMDIKTGQECTIRILDEFVEKSGGFDFDLLSPRALDRYFEYFYHERESVMDYALPKPNGARTMVKILAHNTESVHAYRSRNGKNPDLVFRQSFRTAGKAFHVIEQNTMGILVPFEEGKEIINRINGQSDKSQLKEYLKQAQQFSVNVYESDLRKLEAEGALVELKGGLVIALREGFYHHAFGIDDEQNEPIEFMSF